MSRTVGREAELHAIDGFVAHGAGVLAIVGEPGIGKTTLWREGVERARTAGVTVLSARPSESEAKLSFAGLTDLLAGLPEELLERLPAPQRNGIEAALLRRSADRAPAPRVIGAALLSVLRMLVEAAPVLVAVDDLQWLDAPSAAAVEFALRRLGGERVSAIVSTRPGEIDRFPVKLGHELPVQWLEPGALSVGALHRIVADGLGRTFPRPVLGRIAEASGGNPLYALEIARALTRNEPRTDAERLPAPASVDAIVRGRVRGLPAETRTALLRTAALARPHANAVAARDLAAAEDAGLVWIADDGRIHFVHPLFASAVYSSAPLTERREMHRALADVVSDPEERARHLGLAAESPDADVAAELAAAARLARQRGAPDAAAELTELAVRLLPPATDAGYDLQLDLAEYLYLASDFRRAREILRELVGILSSGERRSRALLRLADIEYWASGESVALRLAEEALQAAEDPAQRARCLISIALKAGTVDLERAAAAAGDAVALLEALPQTEPASMAAALAARVRADLFLGRGLDAAAAERALALEAPAPPATVDDRVTFKLGQWLRYVDDLDGARSQLVDAERQAREEGDESSLANILLNRVIAETWAGEWTEAGRLADRMVDAFEQHGVVAGGVDLWRAYVAAHVGNREAVEAAAERAPKEEPIIAAVWSRSLGLAALAAGDVEAADRHLSDAVEKLERIAFCEPAIWRIDGDAIEAAVANGAHDRAERWLQRLEERAAGSAVPWSLAVSARCRGLVLAAQGDLDGAAEALEDSLREHERCPVPFERARTLLVQGRVLRRLKQKRKARTALEEARAICARLGSDAWVARVDTELQRVAVRKAPDELSPTELRIAQLAAAGLSNPEIAAEVFVSRKTVEANLARAFRKLGVSSRAQLGRVLDRHTEPIS